MSRHEQQFEILLDLRRELDTVYAALAAERAEHEKTKCERNQAEGLLSFERAGAAKLREALEAYLDTCGAWGDVGRCACECCVPARAAIAATDAGKVTT